MGIKFHIRTLADLFDHIHAEADPPDEVTVIDIQMQMFEVF